ncbi:MAG: hypothetical protein HON43_01705 [Alphaproteobacteria bacterium]|jgi:hypothetical protein|nr:hypothetical protein [Alphaproteobacteria bacterium]MBT5390626.1 hypothetical protein [Alphaproteobacteria bacterium]MBT5540780.1 hypothetical protein [Alphaproteobacteria bacterium]
MNFDKFFIQSTYPEGYQAPSTQGISSELPLLAMEDQGILPALNFYMELPLAPQELILNCTLKPVPLMHTDIGVAFQHEQRASVAVAYYDLGNLDQRPLPETTRCAVWERDGILCRSIQIGAMGGGFYRGSSQEEERAFEGFEVGQWRAPHGVLYEKPYKTVERNFTVHFGMDAQRRLYMTPPDRVNAIPVFPYAGYFRPGMPLEEMVQLYGQILPGGKGPVVSVTTPLNWQDRNVVPARGGTIPPYDVIFVTPPDGCERISLREAIYGGHVKCSIEALQDEKHQVMFRSVGFRGVSSDSHRVEIVFLRVEEEGSSQ